MVIRFKQFWKGRYLLFIYLLITLPDVCAQNYHGVQGSSYAGSIGVANNPASIVNTPFPWDVTLFAAQLKNATNAFTILNYSLLSSPAKSMYSIDAGNYSRFIHTNVNVHLLNARLAINKQHAVAFGINIRGYGQIETGPYNFIDTLNTLRDFLKINEVNTLLKGDFKSSTWIELFGTYSRTILDGEQGRLNAGVTVKINRGISGAHLNLQNASVQKVAMGSRVDYIVKSGKAGYGYSSNFDSWKNDKTNKSNVRDFINISQGSVSFDAGAEYLVKSQAVTNFNDEYNHHEYEWKIGFSLLDIGSNKFRYGIESRAIADPQPSITDINIEDRFESIKSIRAFNDSLVGIVNDINTLSGKFFIINPTRLVVNVDRPLMNDFYLNGELSLNLSSLAVNKLFTKEINLLTVTPRWETRRWGVYLPIQYNTEGQFWMGGAFKAGPLLVGIHNLATVLAKNRLQNGGAYLALVIRPGNDTRTKQDRRMDCPKY